MSRLEFVDDPINDYFDVRIEVVFERPLTPVDVHQLLQRVVNITSGQLAMSLFEGFSSFCVHPNMVRTDVRFANVPPNSQLSGEEQEDRSRQQVQFIFYFFAAIGHVYPFAAHPFPVGYEAFLRMPEEVGFDNEIR